MIRNIGTIDFEDAFAIRYLLSGDAIHKSIGSPYLTRVNSQKLPIRVGEALPVEISLMRVPLRGETITFFIDTEIYEPYHNSHINLDELDSTNNRYDYKVDYEHP